MKKLTFLYLSIFIGLLLAAFASTSPVSAQRNCDIFYGNSIPDDQIDGTIGSEWDDAGTYANVSISPWGMARIWAKQDGTYVYIALGFVADSKNPWVSFQLGTTFCMSTSADGALFGDDTYSPNGYQDIHFTEGAGVAPDAIQDGKGAISVNSSKFVIVEMKKPLNSGDLAGKDINWTRGNICSLSIAWDSDGGGSSGGSANHIGGIRTAMTMLINQNRVPEFPNLIFLFSLMVMTIPAIILGKRWRESAPKTTTNSQCAFSRTPAS